jgi:gluconolactonase
MKILTLLASVVSLSAFAETPAFQGSIERLDPALDALLASDAKVEHLASGYKWSEGPVWMGSSVVFSDVPNNTAFEWKEGAKEASVFLKPSGSVDPSGQGSNGLARNKDGQLLLCQHGDRCVARLEKDGRFTQLATQFEGKRFNSPNDLCLHDDGSVFFTDPPYGLKDKSKAEMGFNGVFKLSADGKVTLVTKALNWPNGIALSPDQKTLYVAVSDPAQPRVMAYNLDGSGERLVFDATSLKSPEKKGGCDGMKVDQKGNIWTTGPGGVLILSPEGKHLGSILTGQPTANCAFGGDGSTLYITANMHLVRVKTLTKGTGQW